MISLTGTGNQKASILFKERQGAPVYIVGAVIFVFIAIAVFTAIESDKALSLISAFIFGGLMIIVLALVLAPKTVTTVNETDVWVHRRFSFHYGWLFEEVIRAEVMSYKAATEQHGRFSLMLSAMHLLHDAGVLIHLKDGKLTFISSKRSNELEEAINLGRENFERRQYE